MPWFKVDDNLAHHRKTVAAGNAAMGLWVRAGAWCAQQLTDGYVPDHMVPSLGSVGQAKRLTEVGLWHRVEEGYQFHEWDIDGRNPTRAETEERRSEDRKRKARERAERNGVRR